MVFKTFAIILGTISVTVWSHDKFFRRDYTYVDEYNAFYKLHSADASSWEEAFLTCDDEGAQFFYPIDEDEWRVAANLTESSIDVEGIFIGIRDEFGRGDFLTIDGRFFPDFFKNSIRNQDVAESKCIVMSVRTGANNIGSCKHRRAFICKKFDNENCPTSDSGYVYSKVTNKCFKMNERKKTWDEAMHTCSMEGAILSTAILKLSTNSLSRIIDRDEEYFIGVRTILPQETFYTTQGSKVYISGERGFDCGSIIWNTRNDNYNSDIPYINIKSADCNHTLPFICEMNLNL